MADNDILNNNLFFDFLNGIDRDHLDYFSGNEFEQFSIHDCFGVNNYTNLIYKQSSNLRSDIYQIVVDKHKELWGDRQLLTLR